MSAVRIRDLRRSFAGIAVLAGLDLDIAPGEFVALLGRSGSGKTTLLRILAGLDHPEAGEVDVPPARAAVFQEPRLLPWKRVWKNVALGLVTDRRGRALAALHEVELDHRAQAWPLTLSGGEAQRAGLARALVREPDLLLLDEPFGALDALTRLRMQRLVGRLWEAHRCAALLVTHDVEEALLLADRVLLLANGAIAGSWRVDVKRPRRGADSRIVALKASLLQALGVNEPADDFPGDSTAAPRRVDHRMPV
jgi:sulfonate transport system ATP-binding protein